MSAKQGKSPRKTKREYAMEIVELKVAEIKASEFDDIEDFDQANYERFLMGSTLAQLKADLLRYQSKNAR